jgi:hypothetical protein
MKKEAQISLASLPKETSRRREELRRYLESEPAVFSDRLSSIIKPLSDKGSFILLDLIKAATETRMVSEQILLRCMDIQKGLRKIVLSGDKENFLPALDLLLRCPNINVFDVLWDIGCKVVPLPESVYTSLSAAINLLSIDDALKGLSCCHSRALDIGQTRIARLILKIQKQTKLVGLDNVVGPHIRERLRDFLRSYNGKKLILLGDSSTGKSHIAEVIHNNLKNGRFVKFDCPNETIASIRERIISADGGTLFLDEVHALSDKSRVQDRMLMPLSEVQDKTQIITATDRITAEQLRNHENPLRLNKALWRRIGLGNQFEVTPLNTRRTDLREWIESECRARYIELDEPLLEKFVSGFDYPNNIDDVKALASELASKTQSYLKEYKLSEEGLEQINANLTGRGKDIVENCLGRR